MTWSRRRFLASSALAGRSVDVHYVRDVRNLASENGGRVRVVRIDCDHVGLAFRGVNHKCHQKNKYRCESSHCSKNMVWRLGSHSYGSLIFSGRDLGRRTYWWRTHANERTRGQE